MFKHIIRKIKAESSILIYSLLYLFITILFLFILIVQRDITINKIESTIVFSENAVYVRRMANTDELPNGFNVTDEQIKEAEDTFQYVNVMRIPWTSGEDAMWVRHSQHVSIQIASKDFVETGVVVRNHARGTTPNREIQKVDLLYGSVWEKDSKEPVVVVDADTANLIYGYTNVVGEKLETNVGELTIIGVVSNTIERAQAMEIARQEGQILNEHTDRLFATYVYISHDYYGTISQRYANNELIIRDDRMSIAELKSKIKEMYRIPQEDEYVVISREFILDQNISSKERFLQTLLSVTAVFSILGLINLINITIYTNKINRKSIGIYKIVGHTNKQMILLSAGEGLIKGLLCSVISVIIGVMVILIIAITNKTIGYVDGTYILGLAGVLILVFTTIILIMNICITMWSIRKDIAYYLEGK